MGLHRCIAQANASSGPTGDFAGPAPRAFARLGTVRRALARSFPRAGAREGRTTPSLRRCACAVSGGTCRADRKTAEGDPPMDRARYKPLAEYALIGDRRTCALVGTDGSIDSFCFPRFDSPSVFAALVDADRGGYWQIAPHLPDAHRRQVYIPDTNVLLTRALSTDGVGEIIDFMPIGRRGEPRALIRRAH